MTWHVPSVLLSPSRHTRNNGCFSSTRAWNACRSIVLEYHTIFSWLLCNSSKTSWKEDTGHLRICCNQQWQLEKLCQSSTYLLNYPPHQCSQSFPSAEQAAVELEPPCWHKWQLAQGSLEDFPWWCSNQLVSDCLDWKSELKHLPRTPEILF